VGGIDPPYPPFAILFLKVYLNSDKTMEV